MRFRIACPAFRPALVMLAAAWLVGCANYAGIAPGTPAAAVESGSGKPHRIWPEANGATTWEYPMGPEGRYTYMVRMTADGHVSRVDQVLGWPTFNRVTPGMTMTEVEHLLGRPYSKATYPATGQTAWAWRFMENVWPRCFYAYEGSDHRVVSTGAGNEWPGTLGVGLEVPC